MGKLIAIMVVALIFEAIGVVYLNRGLKQLPPISNPGWPQIRQLVRAGLTNRSILNGVAFEALFFAGILVLMSKGDVSFIWPLTSLGFVLTTLAARFILGETVSPVRWFGVFLIVIGACLIIWSEKNRENPGGEPMVNGQHEPGR